MGWLGRSSGGLCLPFHMHRSPLLLTSHHAHLEFLTVPAYSPPTYTGLLILYGIISFARQALSCLRTELSSAASARSMAPLAPLSPAAPPSPTLTRPEPIKRTWSRSVASVPTRVPPGAAECHAGGLFPGNPISRSAHTSWRPLPKDS